MESTAPARPLRKYNLMKRAPPKRISKRGPKKNSTSMLKKMCMKFACTNM